MPRSERPWEEGSRRDGEVSESASWAIGVAFSLAMILSLIAVGFTIQGLLVGLGLGVVTIIVLSRLVARSNRERSGGPPPRQLL